MEQKPFLLIRFNILLKVLPQPFSLCLLVICGWVAGSYIANLGWQPRGQSWTYYRSQLPTTIVCAFVYRKICRSNPMCGGKWSGRFDSMCEGFYLKEIQYPNIKLCRLHYRCPLQKCVRKKQLLKSHTLLHIYWTAAALGFIHQEKTVTMKKWSLRNWCLFSVTINALLIS